MLAKSAIYFPCCNNCNVEKVYEQGPVPFFSMYCWAICFQQTVNQINTAHTFVIRINEMWLCDFFSSSFYPPPYFCAQVYDFPSYLRYLRQSCRAISQSIPFHHCSNCMCLFLFSEALCFKQAVYSPLLFCFVGWFLWLGRFFQLLQSSDDR